MPHVRLRGIPSGDRLEIQRGDTATLTITRLGDISGRDKLWFTVKDGKSDADGAAQVQIEETDGLLAIAGTPATVPANGSITVDNAALGNITVTLEAVEVAKLDDVGVWYYDVQMLDVATVTTLLRGRAVVVGDSTRAVS